jgi:hypothetical protein
VTHLDGNAPAPRRWTRTGIALMVISIVLWAPLLVVPFLPLALELRALLGGGLLVGAELFFWVGAVLAGPEALKRSWRWLRDRLPILRIRSTH